MQKPDKIFPRHKKATLKETVIDEIIKAIADGRMQPNEKVNESQMALEMGLSKSPVREAVNELVKEGILTSLPYKGAVVKEMSLKEFRELFSMRVVLESFAIDLALPRITQEDITEFGRIIDDMSLAANREDRERVIEDDLKFHNHLVKRADHGILLRIWENIATITKITLHQKFQLFPDLVEVTDIHKALFERIIQGDKKAIRKEMEEHLDNHNKLIDDYDKASND